MNWKTATLLGQFLSAEIKFARGPQMSKGLIFFAEGFKNQAQVIMGVGKIGISIKFILQYLMDSDFAADPASELSAPIRDIRGSNAWVRG